MHIAHLCISAFESDLFSISYCSTEDDLHYDRIRKEYSSSCQLARILTKKKASLSLRQFVFTRTLYDTTAIIIELPAYKCSKISGDIDPVRIKL
jgi:hypothetical protein